MALALHPLTPDHLPSFITAPGNTDVLLVVMAIILLLLRANGRSFVLSAARFARTLGAV